jgi:hypothetical protein
MFARPGFGPITRAAHQLEISHVQLSFDFAPDFVWHFVVDLEKAWGKETRTNIAMITESCYELSLEKFRQGSTSSLFTTAPVYEALNTNKLVSSDIASVCRFDSYGAQLNVQLPRISCCSWRMLISVVIFELLCGDRAMLQDVLQYDTDTFVWDVLNRLVSLSWHLPFFGHSAIQN